MKKELPRNMIFCFCPLTRCAIAMGVRKLYVFEEPHLPLQAAQKW
jgi:hypothetical protein